MRDWSSALRQTSQVQLSSRLRDAITRFNRRLRQTRPIDDPTVAQMPALQNIDAAAAMTPRELADVERVRPPTTTPFIARLEEHGLIQRTAHPTDGRQVVLALSPRARELLTALGRVRRRRLASRLASLTAPERDILARAAELLSRIART